MGRPGRERIALGSGSCSGSALALAPSSRGLAGPGGSRPARAPARLELGRGRRDGRCECPQLVVILEAGSRFGSAARHRPRTGARQRSRRRRCRRRARPRGSPAPLPRWPRAPAPTRTSRRCRREPRRRTCRAGESRCGRRQRLNLGAAANARGLDHAAAGPARRLGAERRTLVAVELQHRQPDLIGGVDNLVKRRVDEYADQLDAPAVDRGDLGRIPIRHRRLRASPQDHPQGPGACLHRRVGIGELVIPQNLILGAVVSIALIVGRADRCSGRRWRSRVGDRPPGALPLRADRAQHRRASPRSRPGDSPRGRPRRSGATEAPPLGSRRPSEPPGRRDQGAARCRPRPRRDRGWRGSGHSRARPSAQIRPRSWLA